MDSIICTRRISIYVEGKCFLEDLKARVLEYEIVGKFLANIKKEFEGKDGKTVKEVGAGKKDNRRVCIGIQKSSKKK